MPVSGGLAADGARFDITLVGVNEPPGAGRVGASALYGGSVRCGSAGRWDLFGPLRRATASRSRVWFEFDGEPALILYERYLGDEADGLPATGPYYALNDHDATCPEARMVRTVLGVDREVRSMTFAGPIAQSSTVPLMRGTHERLVKGAAEAARLPVRSSPGQYKSHARG